MPALIIFGPPRPSSDRVSGTQNDAIKVSSDAEDAVRRLSEAESGFASLEIASDPSMTVWINVQAVRMVREVP